MFSAERLLGWLKSTQKDTGVYRENLNRLRSRAERIAEDRKPKDDSIVLQRQFEVEKMFSKLEELIADRCNDMQNLVSLANYNQESQDLESWINEQLEIAMSEDYGQDFEHLQVSSSIQLFRRSPFRIYGRILMNSDKTSRLEANDQSCVSN